MTAAKIKPIVRRRGERLSFDPSGPLLVPTKAPAPTFAQPTPPAPEPSPPVDPEPDPPGPIEAQARLDIDALSAKVPLIRAEKTLAESVYALARGIDGTAGGNGSTLAAMAAAAKELRTTLDRLLELIAGRTDSSDPRLNNMGTPT